MKLYLFLDFDGVLHPTTCLQADFFTRSELLAESLANSTVEIVISSSWRHHHPLSDLLLRLPNALAKRVIGTTGEPVIGRHSRYQEIQLFLRNVSGPAEWRALDDSKFEFPDNLPELIYCNPNFGFTGAEGKIIASWIEANGVVDTMRFGVNDPLFETVRDLVINNNNASIAFVQRQTLIGYGRAKALIEALEGTVLTPPQANGIRQVIV